MIRVSKYLVCLLLALLPATALWAQQPKSVNNDVWSIAISRDGKTLAASSGWWVDAPGEIGVWDFATKKPLQKFGEERGICSVAISNDGKLLASGSWTGHLHLYDWAAGKEIADFDAGGVARIAISPNDELLAAASERGTLQLWDVKRRMHLADLDGELMRFHVVVFSPDGKKLLAGGGDWKQGGVNQVGIWDVESKKQIQKLVGHQNAVVCIAFSPDGKTIATGGVDKTIRFWDAESARPIKTLKGHTYWVEALVFTADGKTLISSSHDRTVRFWNLETNQEDKARQLTLPGSVRTICLSPDERWLIVGGGPKLLRVYDFKTLALADTLWDGGGAAFVLRAVPGQNEVVMEMPKLVDMDNQPIAAVAPARDRMGLVLALILSGVLCFSLLLAMIGLFVWRRTKEQAKAG